jgi:hypothetical protein
MYLTCEQDFEEGIKIYKAIVSQRLLNRTEGEAKSLDRDLQRLYDYDENNITGSKTEVIQEIKDMKVEPMIQESVKKIEPVIQEPVIQEPVIQEPAIQEPIENPKDEYVKENPKP